MAQSQRKPSGTKRSGTGKVAVTVRLDPARAAKLRAAAARRNCSVTAYVEDVLAQELDMREPVDGLIKIYSAPDMPAEIDPADIIRADDETDEQYKKSQDLMMALWSLPSSD